jgi:hypothetical protein
MPLAIDTPDLANASGVGWYSTLSDMELHCGDCP